MYSKKQRLTLYVILTLLMAVFFIPSASIFCQEKPKYDFIEFGSKYDKILSQAKNGDYTVKEEEIKEALGM